ncbi:MAG: hypothetical protein ACXVRE_02445 [Gaiellaceae bacterium]
MNPSVRALARFWWLVVAGLIVGGLAAVLVYSVQHGKRHVATAQLLVNSPSAPYLRGSETTIAGQSTRLRPTRTTSTGGAVPPDTQTLVNAANLYPFLLESDRIARYRESLYGPTPGTLTAVAHNASTNTYGVYHPSPLPIIDVTAKAKLASDASALVQNTIQAFSKWVGIEQRTTKIPASERLQVQELTAPVVTSTGGPKLGLPIFIGALVFLAFCGLAIVLGRSAGESAPAAASHRSQGTSASPNLDS